MKILVYDDNPIGGGHQVMACHGIAALAAAPSANVVCMIHPKNQLLINRLSLLENIQILDADPSRLKTIQPDLVLCIQGDIAQCTKGIHAAVKAKIECISYLAIPHRLTDMGATFGALRDLKNHPLFNRPDRYITLSESMKKMLKERGTKKEICVVPNGIPRPPAPKRTSRESAFTIGLVGRIEFNQKQQDFFVRTVLQHSQSFSNCKILFIGNGPDEQKLRRLIQGNDTFNLLPWQENMEAIYARIDLLAIPSRYEGVPLVMLEALARGIPVMGSRCDGMLEILPADWTFTPEDSSALAATFSTVRNHTQAAMESLQNRIITDYSMKAFKQNFVQALIKT
ncbi:MAG: glycosyltransferase [Pontiella sp.]